MPKDKEDVLLLNDDDTKFLLERAQYIVRTLERRLTYTSPESKIMAQKFAFDAIDGLTWWKNIKERKQLYLNKVNRKPAM